MLTRLRSLYFPLTSNSTFLIIFFILLHDYRKDLHLKKIFQTYDQLILFLQTQKDLIINDKNYAKQTLAKTSYFSLISGYKNFFNYQNVPLWIMIQILTLGQISHMYDFLKASVSIKICQDHHNIKIKDMHSFLSIMTKHRNVCAHGDRLFNYVTKDCITDTAIHKKLG